MPGSRIGAGGPFLVAQALAVATLSGHFALATTQLVLVEGEQDAVRTDHNQRLLFGRASAAAATPGAPWYLWKKQIPQIEPEEDARRVNYDLTPFRNTAPAATTLNQSWIQYGVIPDQTVEEDAVRGNHTLLHRYRQSFQTVGQNYRLWPKPQARIDDEQYTVPPPASIFPYRGTSVTVTAGQPYWLWPRIKVDVPVEDDAQRVNNSLLHLYRVGYQTVGQSWYLWKPAVADQTVEPDAQRSDHSLIHRYRQAYQTVGQSWQYWIKPQARVDEEGYTVPPPASLYPYRQIVITAQPGQPWYMWPAAVADQTVEPNPVVIDHAELLYPFRPHDAITPIEPVIPPVIAGGGARVEESKGNRR
jgi:hypothetical protein